MNETLHSALRRLVITRNPNTQFAVMMLAADIFARHPGNPAWAVDRACRIWDECVAFEAAKQKVKLTWELEERYAADFIKGRRRNDAGWREILTRGAQ